MKFATIRFDDENVLLIAIDLDTKEIELRLADEKNNEVINYTVTAEE